MDSKIYDDFDMENSTRVDIALSQIKRKEEEIELDLTNLLSKQCQIESKMTCVTRAVLMLRNLARNSKKLDKQIGNTACLAESVSAKVRRLDIARSRVSECQQRVHDLIDLQLCSQGVMAAIAEEDFEIGANHINRFLAMDLQLLKRTADDVQGSVSSVSEAINTLEKATLEMRDLINKKFNEAVKKDDLASVERYFKIYPLLGQHQEGIEKFSNYICMKLSLKAQKELGNAFEVAKAENRLPLAYADTLTLLLENFARVVKVNQPIVQACYGSGYLIYMLEVLQHHCDIEVKNLLLEFNKYRKIGLRIQQINEGYSRGSGNSNPNSSMTLGHYRNPSGGSIDKLNPKDIDSLTAEITVMHSRVEFYFRFMKRRITVDIKATLLDKIQQQKELQKANIIFYNSDLSRQMQELLGTYLLFER